MRRFSLALSLLALAACGGETAASSTSTSSGTTAATTTTAAGAGGAGGGAIAGGAGGTGTTSATGSTGTGGATTGAGAGGAGGSGGSAGGPPLDGYGGIAGACGEIDLADLVSASPEVLENVVDFTGQPAFDVSSFSPEGQAMVAKGNLGGSSVYSEVMAFEMLRRCDGAKLIKTESEIAYDTSSKKTDLLVEIDGARVGVSVVRAMSYPEGTPYPVATAKSKLEGKLADILLSSASVSAADSWKKQILAVIAQTPDHAAAIQQAYATIDAATKADTIVAITVSEGTDQFLYYDK